ncbi:MAG TPA: TIGR00730 family Rossman fold protein [Oligoflexia bacterium]|nr:TIGR00730 family Rossman fold protein [Oligoflexia bacterium]HMR24638.1 TIGR00730 family Rossman fold protein [Oligoflexia bacterium]
MKNIAVYLSAYSNDENMIDLTKNLARLMVEQGFSLVFGGSGTGLMKVLADTVLNNKGKVTGITMESLKKVSMPNLTELIIAIDLNERKQLLQKHADAFIALPGGNGTLDEIIQTIEERKQGFHHKPIVILNYNGFYDPLLAQYNKMKDLGFLPKNQNLDDLFVFVDTSEQAIKYIHATLK